VRRKRGLLLGRGGKKPITHGPKRGKDTGTHWPTVPEKNTNPGNSGGDRSLEKKKNHNPFPRRVRKKTPHGREKFWELTLVVS